MGTWPRRTAPQDLDDGSGLGEVLHAGARGTVGAMAMTGMRVITTELGLVEQTPPQAIARQRSAGCGVFCGWRRVSNGGG